MRLKTIHARTMQEAMELVSSIYAAKRMNEGFREAAGKVTGAMEAAANATAAAGEACDVPLLGRIPYAEMPDGRVIEYSTGGAPASPRAAASHPIAAPTWSPLAESKMRSSVSAGGGGGDGKGGGNSEVADLNHHPFADEFDYRYRIVARNTHAHVGRGASVEVLIASARERLAHGAVARQTCRTVTVGAACAVCQRARDA